MKSEALQALQHVRATLAYQLTPEAVEELVGSIQRVLEGEYVLISRAGVANHNAKVNLVLKQVRGDLHVAASWGFVPALVEERAESAIRSLRL